MARVYNRKIKVTLAGDAVVKQYFSAGPLMVKLPGDRAEIRVLSGDYICYDGDTVVGVVGGAYIDAMRADKDDLDAPVTPTGAHLNATLTKADGTALPYEPGVLKQGGVVLAEGMSDEKGEIYFNVLPGTYQVGPKDAALGPEQTVEAVIETEVAPPPPEGGVTRLGGQAGGARPDNSLPGDRYDVMGKPDPQGNYNARGELLSVVNQGRA